MVVYVFQEYDLIAGLVFGLVTVGLILAGLLSCSPYFSELGESYGMVIDTCFRLGAALWPAVSLHPA